jgi:hypothetical protein
VRIGSDQPGFIEKRGTSRSGHSDPKVAEPQPKEQGPFFTTDFTDGTERKRSKRTSAISVQTVVNCIRYVWSLTQSLRSLRAFSGTVNSEHAEITES